MSCMFGVFIMVKIMNVLLAQNMMNNSVTIGLADTATSALTDCKYFVACIVLIREYLTKVGPLVRI